MRQGLSITLIDGRQIAGFTRADSRSSYGWAVFRFNYIDIGEKYLLTLDGQEALPVRAVWEDKGWWIYQPTEAFAHPCGAIHKETGLVSGLVIDGFVVEDLYQEMADAGERDGDMAAWISDMVKKGRMEADETVTDWTGQTIGLILG